jgi:hypothetical protein
VGTFLDCAAAEGQEMQEMQYLALVTGWYESHDLGEEPTICSCIVNPPDEGGCGGQAGRQAGRHSAVAAVAAVQGKGRGEGRAKEQTTTHQTHTTHHTLAHSLMGPKNKISTG